jgi:hypothetical protein
MLCLGAISLSYVDEKKEGSKRHAMWTGKYFIFAHKFALTS